MIDNNVDGVMNTPYDLATDGTWLYVTDFGLHRVLKFKLDDGSYGGWIGRISASPTGGDPGCGGAPVGTFTPGWCKGGYSTYANGYGALYNPAGITYLNGSLYVVNRSYHSVVKYNAVTGNFEGWIGRTNALPTIGCTPQSNGSYSVSYSGWCTDGTSQGGNAYSRGGSFNFNDQWSAAITNDGTDLYVTHGYARRVEKFNTSGEWLGALNVDSGELNGLWSNNPAVVSGWTGYCSRSVGMWMSGNDMYTLNRNACSYSGSNTPMYIAKIDKTTGNIIGWKGAIDPDFPPTGGDPGCVGASLSTPGWCTGGRIGVGSKLGQFTHNSLGSITGDAHFLYVTDYFANRVMRVPR
jgi:hypothetical protein